MWQLLRPHDRLSDTRSQVVFLTDRGDFCEVLKRILLPSPAQSKSRARRHRVQAKRQVVQIGQVRLGEGEMWQWKEDNQDLGELFVR